MKLLRTSAVLLAATAAAAAAMLATSDVVRPAQMGGDGMESHEAAGPESGVPDSQAPVFQDYRASLFALQTGRMSFGQLWFSAAR